MANIVTIDNQRYLVDVGFGSNGPLAPVPMIDGHQFRGFGTTQCKLEYRPISIHSDKSQRLWVFSARENEDAPWGEHYALFDNVEFFPADFEVMNRDTMTSPRSFFVQNVMCLRTILEEANSEFPVGLLIMHQDYVKLRTPEGPKMLVEKMKSETERVENLRQHFGITLSQAEQNAIRGTATELRGPGGHA